MEALRASFFLYPENHQQGLTPFLCLWLNLYIYYFNKVKRIYLISEYILVLFEIFL